MLSAISITTPRCFSLQASVMLCPGGAPGISYYSTYVTDSVEEVLVDLAASV